ncbi:2OG-Fe(II) oxygenase superfamily-domain-containing protein [Ostreococcus tauri]|uniref:2OG-Fe(II) oxygenase superfamily-domain-containing protein n=1 Tax=Ostreococcus tauri TaxID=70448 RepID=A0A1Y5I6V8_OSTTA|nr:2OG-Fe(II) oxygenase superfamily-domain-containing protein [Ostreococcus tauri]
MRARFEEKITHRTVAALRARGHAVIDDFLLDVDANAFRDELERLSMSRDEANGRRYVRSNRTQFGDRGRHSKPNVYECDMHDEETVGETRGSEAYATTWRFFDATASGMANAFVRVAPEMRLRTGNLSRTVKLQVNEGGGACFPWHFDNPSAPSNRALTCILYLNPEWKRGDGGEIRFQPFCGVATTVAPRHNRLVIFWSDRTLHRVMPFHGTRRYAVTVWLDGDFVDERTGASTNVCELNLSTREALDDIAATAKSLAASNVQRALSRAVYADEYEASLVECMGNAPGAMEMLESHYEHCREVKKNKALKALVDALREYRREVETNGLEVNVP